MARKLAHRVIDAGANVFLAHGPHAVRGIELYRGRPIIHSPGDFVFQPHRVERFPSEAYSDHGLPDDAPVDTAHAAMMGPGKRLFEQRAAWEGFGATLRFRGDQLQEFRLLPLDLGFDRPLPERGKPRRADPEVGRRIVADVAELSRPYGTSMRYVEGENIGVIELGDPPSGHRPALAMRSRADGRQHWTLLSTATRTLSSTTETTSRAWKEGSSAPGPLCRLWRSIRGE